MGGGNSLVGTSRRERERMSKWTKGILLLGVWKERENELGEGGNSLFELVRKGSPIVMLL